MVALWFKVPKVQDNELGIETWEVWKPLQQIVGNHYSLLTGSHRYRQWAIMIYKKTGGLYISAPFLGFGQVIDRGILSLKGDYEDAWHNLVFVFDVVTESSTEIIRNHKVYYDGEFIKSGNYNLYRNTGSYGNSFINDHLYFNETSAMRSNLVANIFVGKYRKPDGTVIWTDDYIREVYEVKIPFPVSNKLSIY